MRLKSFFFYQGHTYEYVTFDTSLRSRRKTERLYLYVVEKKYECDCGPARPDTMAPLRS